MSSARITLLSTEEFENLWNNFPEFLRRRRLEKAYKSIRYLIYKQLDSLQKFKTSPINLKQGWHVYVFNTVEGFWDNAELALRVGNRKATRNFAFYPVRMVMETLLRLIYFCKQTQQEREMITAKEILRIQHLLYNREKQVGGDTIDYASEYNKIVREFKVLVPQIDVAKVKDLDPFPDMWKLCSESNLKDPKMLYFFYRYLCEASHGKMIATVIRKQSFANEEYRRALSLLILFCKEMLVLVDRDFLNSEMRTLIEPGTRKIDRIMQGRPTLFEKTVLFVRLRSLKIIY